MSNWIVEDEYLTATVPEIKSRAIGMRLNSTTASADYVWPFYRITAKNINNPMIGRIDELEQLENNWDHDGALAPTPSVIQSAKRFVAILGILGQEIYNVGPGPHGEIMVDIRNGDKSIEFLFYANKTVIVRFSNDQEPTQQDFDVRNFHSLLYWLNA